jgi:hypothetical protein
MDSSALIVNEYSKPSSLTCGNVPQTGFTLPKLSYCTKPSKPQMILSVSDADLVANASQLSGSDL